MCTQRGGERHRRTGACRQQRQTRRRPRLRRRVLVTNMVTAGNRCGMLLWSLAVVVTTVAAELASSSSSSSSEALLASNHQLLSDLGLARLPGTRGTLGTLPKRVLATEDDSRVFVVRLPPSQHYYSLLKSPPALANSVSKQVEVGFRSNGKPARVYHWNIPVLKRMAAARRRSTQGSNKHHGHPYAKPSSAKPTKSPKNPAKGKLGGGSRRKGSSASPASPYHRVQAQQQHVDAEEPAGPSPYYYVPAAKKTAMHKLMGGNGKPHTMYVLEKSKTPAFYQRLLP